MVKIKIRFKFTYDLNKYLSDLINEIYYTLNNKLSYTLKLQSLANFIQETLNYIMLKEDTKKLQINNVLEKYSKSKIILKMRKPKLFKSSFKSFLKEVVLKTHYFQCNRKILEP